MNTTRKTLSALALASAAALATGTFASANPGNLHGPNGASLTPGVQSHGGNTSTVSRNPGVPTQPPGQVISCHPGTGCTRSPTQPPVDKDHDRDHDHDYDHDHDRRHSGHWGYRSLNFPVIEVDGYVPDGCIYVYKYRTVYVPGVGLERALVKVCEAY